MQQSDVPLKLSEVVLHASAFVFVRLFVFNGFFHGRYLIVVNMSVDILVCISQFYVFHNKEKKSKKKKWFFF